MPAVTSFVLKDNAATPVNHTFLPNGKSDAGVFRFTEYGSVPIGRNWASLTFVEKNQGQYIDTELRVGMPLVRTQTVNGVSTPIVVATNTVSLRYHMSRLSDETERANLIAMTRSSQATDQAFLYDIWSKLLSPF